MGNRIGWGAGGVAFVSGAILALFQVQGWKMWPWVAVTLLVLLIATGSIFGMMFLHGLLDVMRKSTPRYGLQWPLFRKDRPAAHQWLLDIAKADESAAANLVAIVGRRVTRWQLGPEVRRPFVVLGISVFNGSVYNVVFGQPSGAVMYRNEPLEESLQNDGGGETRITRAQTYELKLVQYIPKAVADVVFSEIAAVPLAALICQLPQ